MNLDQYLTKHNITSIKFAKSNRFSLSAVAKWRQRDRIPRSKALKKISKITHGKVSISSWYNGE